MLRSVHVIRKVSDSCFVMAATFGLAHIEFEKDKRSAAISLKHQRQTKRGREVMLLALSLTPPR
jgi:hypothetical protein